MTRHDYRARYVAQDKALHPERKIGKAYAKRILQPRGYFILESIRAEIAPKLASLNLLDSDDGFTTSRFSSYQTKGSAGKVQKSAGRGNYMEVYSTGKMESDLSAVNSVRFDTVEREMVPDNGAKN